MAATNDKGVAFFFETRLDGDADARPKAILDQVEHALSGHARSVVIFNYGVISTAVAAAG
ncbi:hypothetical protein [Thioclava sp. GXIMD4215]|uniref:hypothetical protein n=1 Tax=Thioclava sp. GXIMD4215 TaxID=3131928 RepID=UPI00311B03B6